MNILVNFISTEGVCYMGERYKLEEKSREIHLIKEVLISNHDCGELHKIIDRLKKRKVMTYIKL
ncbi:hypothetical protein [Clostridium sp. CTA-7]